MRSRLSRLSRTPPDEPRSGAVPASHTRPSRGLAAAAGTAGPDVVGALDDPTAELVLAPGPLTLRGWALAHRGTLRGVVVSVDDIVLGATTTGGARPDVAASLPGIPGADHAGWTMTVDVPACDSRVARIEVHALVTVQGDDGRSRVPRPALLARRSLPFSRTRPEVRDGCFLEEVTVTVGPTKVFGLAEAPGGVARVEVFCDGVSAGLSRTGLPGWFEQADQGPASRLSMFEVMVEVPEGATSVVLTATATDMAGQEFSLRSWAATVAEPSVSDYDALRLDRVRRQSAAAVAAASAEPMVDGATSSAPRVLVATHDLGLGGGQLYLHELLRRLARRGVDLYVTSRHGGALVPELEDLGASVLVTGPLDAHDAEAYEAQVRAIALWGAHHRCEAAIVNTLGAHAGADAAMRLGLPTTWAIHESFPLDQYWSQAYLAPHPAYVAERSALVLAAADRVVFEAQSTHDLFAEHLRPQAGVVVPYGVDLDEIEEYRSSHDRESVRVELGLEPATLVLLCIGTFEPRKAQIPIGLAFAGSDVVRAGDVTLVMVGAVEHHPYTHAFEEMARAFDGARIVVEPVQAEIFRWYLASDVIVCGSDVESLPRSMLEAMAFGRAVASTAVFGVPDLVRDGENGFLCAPRDLGALRSMIERVVRTPREELDRMGEAARLDVLERHDPEVYGEFYHQTILEQVAGRRKVDHG